jgi:hypothetical protein
MKMSMDVDLETFSYTVRVQWDMTQDELIHKHTNTMDLLEADISVLLVLEDVMVTTHQDLTTIQPAHQMQRLLVDNNVTKMIHSILRLDLRVPTLDHCLIHLLRRGERPQRTTIFALKLFP